MNKSQPHLPRSQVQVLNHHPLHIHAQEQGQGFKFYPRHIGIVSLQNYLALLYRVQAQYTYQVSVYHDHWFLCKQDFRYPDNVAFPFGGPESPDFLVAEVHYDNPHMIAGMPLSCHQSVFDTTCFSNVHAHLISDLPEPINVSMHTVTQSFPVQFHLQEPEIALVFDFSTLVLQESMMLQYYILDMMLIHT